MSTNSEIDPWGRFVVDPDRIFELLYLGAKPRELVCEINQEIAKYNKLCHEWGKPEEALNQTFTDTDQGENRQQRIDNWNISEDHMDIDVKDYLISLCRREEEIARVNYEMALFEEQNLVPLLKLMICLIEHFRNKSIVWGVGRGSSVASYCLFLIGAHKIDSIYYGLDVRDFLR